MDDERLLNWARVIEIMIGAGFALFTTMLVAYIALARERRRAAFFLTGELKKFEVFAEAIESLPREYATDFHSIDTQIGVQAAAAGLSPTDPMRAAHITLAADVLLRVRMRPSLPNIFDQTVAQIMYLDDFMAAHLSLFASAVRAAGSLLDDGEKQLQAQLDGFRAQELKANKLRLNLDGVNPPQLQQAAKHAKYARKHMKEVILDYWAFHNRLQRKTLTDEQRERLAVKEGLKEEKAS